MSGDSDASSSKNLNKDPNSNFTAPNLQKTSSWFTRSKLLSPEFSNVKDEAELGKLMGDDGEKLLALVDDIRKIDSLRNEELDIPQIVVIGDTSTGKSSVLQALTRLPFPVATDLCTRFVTETTIRRCGLLEGPGYKIEVKMDGSQAAPFLPKSYESDKWVDVYQHLREDIDDAFERMGPAHLLPPGTGVPHTGLPAREGNTTASLRQLPVPQLLRHRLQITVRKRNQAHFSIVDIPGLVSSGAAFDIRLSVELAREYIRNQHAIVLAITPANNVIVNEKWLNLVTEEHALDRTIGVITKTDRIEELGHEMTFSLLRNRAGSEHHLKLGWFAVRNRSSKEINDGESFEDRDKKEDSFFRSGKWKDATSNFPSWGSIDPKVLGIQHLKQTLQGHLYRRVKEKFPDLRTKMRNLEIDYTAKIQGMGLPRDKPQDQRFYLSEFQTLYESEVRRSLDGDYRFVDDPKHPSRLRYHVKTFNDEFESAIQLKAIKYSWEFDDVDGADGDNILQWINNTWDANRGSEPRHDTPHNLKKELVKQQTKDWEVEARKYLGQVEKAIQACNDDVFKFACKDDDLRSKIREKLQAREKKAFEAAKAELRYIVQDCEYIDSWNPQIDAIFVECQRARVARHVKGQLSQYKKNSQTETETTTSEVSSDQLAAREYFYTVNRRVYAVHDWLFAYWRVAYPRFVDNVIIQVVERHLMSSNGPLRLFNKNWIFGLEDEELEELVGENAKTRAEREDLKERLEGLQKALEKADLALGSRT